MILPASEVALPAETHAAHRIRVDVAYDGTEFAGWARQPGMRTVQGEIETALAAILRRHHPIPDLVVAGRTDAGVHAAAQVAHFDLTAEQAQALVQPRLATGNKPKPPLAVELFRRISGILVTQPDVVIKDVTLAPAGFDARFSAVWRRYEYRIADTIAARDPLQRTRTTWHPVELDLDAMDAAARTLVGLHDFATYCKPREGSTTIRTLQDFRWRRDPDGVLVAYLQADAFCHSMVRALVGACVAVGEGKLAGSRLVNLRVERARTSEFKVMPAQGLTLTQVGYPEDSALAMRALATRARRELPEE